MAVGESKASALSSSRTAMGVSTTAAPGVASLSLFCFFLAAASRAAEVMSSPKIRRLSALLWEAPEMKKREINRDELWTAVARSMGKEVGRGRWMPAGARGCVQVQAGRTFSPACRA